MPVEQARIHGIQRGPHITESPPTEHLSYSPSGDGVPVDELETNVDDTANDHSTVTQHPDSD